MTRPDLARAERLAAIADALIRDEPALSATDVFGEGVRQGDGGGPSVLIGDQAPIELFSGETTSTLDYRMALLARPGDLVVVRHKDPAFDAYLREWLGLTGVTVLQAASDPVPVARQCWQHASLRQPILARLREAGGLTIKSYITTGEAWRLAQALTEEARDSVHVFGPAPRIGRRVNDKLWFWRLARDVLGRSGVPPTYHAFGPAAAAAQVASIGRSGRDAIVKVPGSAGGVGNLRLPAFLIGRLRTAQLRILLIRRLRAVGWAGRFPILVGVWERGVTQSPSAQVFIPLPSEGDPVVTGLFEQHVAGTEGEFVGAVPARLSTALTRRMMREARELATILQALGYFGPCSFDAVLQSDDGEVLHWIECNGRWSGVSIPSDAATSLLGANPSGFVIAQDHLESAPRGTADVVRRLEDLLYKQAAPRRGVVLMAPPERADALFLSAFAVAPDQAEAEALLSQARIRLKTS